MSRVVILAVIFAEGIGIAHFAGFPIAVGWFVFWVLIAWWNLVEVLMERHSGS
jgi:hypothetical protein